MIGTVITCAVPVGFAARMTRGPFRRAVTATSSLVVVVVLRLAAVVTPVVVEVMPVVMAINCLVGSSVDL